MPRRDEYMAVAESVPYDPTKEPDCDLVSENVQDAIDELCGRIESNVGDLFKVNFTGNGNSSDKWLGFDNGSTRSDEIPFIAPYNSTLDALTFSNNNDDVDTDAELHINGLVVFTWEIRNKRTAFKTDITSPVIVQGDRISLFMKKVTSGTGTTIPQDPTLSVWFSINDDNNAEGGTQFGL
jgi:hypothetical protein